VSYHFHQANTSRHYVTDALGVLQYAVKVSEELSEKGSQKYAKSRCDVGMNRLVLQW